MGLPKRTKVIKSDYNYLLHHLLLFWLPVLAVSLDYLVFWCHIDCFPPGTNHTRRTGRSHKLHTDKETPDT